MIPSVERLEDRLNLTPPRPGIVPPLASDPDFGHYASVQQYTNFDRQTEMLALDTAYTASYNALPWYARTQMEIEQVTALLSASGGAMYAQSWHDTMTALRVAADKDARGYWELSDYLTQHP